MSAAKWDGVGGDKLCLTGGGLPGGSERCQGGQAFAGAASHGRLLSRLSPATTHSDTRDFGTRECRMDRGESGGHGDQQQNPALSGP